MNYSNIKKQQKPCRLLKRIYTGVSILFSITLLFFWTYLSHATDFSKGKKWAVVIGINEYEDPIPDLEYGESDALAVGTVLRQQGYNVKEIKTSEATREAIVEELKINIPERVGVEDELLIYFSGHGVDEKLPNNGRRGFLLPTDAKYSDLERYAIPMSLVRELGNKLPAKHILFVIDSCYSGIGGRGKSFDPEVPLTTDFGVEVFHKHITKEPGRWLITAGNDEQKAWENQEWGHSVFTYFFLKAIGNEAQADDNMDGLITTHELSTFLLNTVFKWSLAQGRTQTPELWQLTDGAGQFVFVSPQERLISKPERTRPPSVPPPSTLARPRPLPPPVPEFAIDETDFAIF